MLLLLCRRIVGTGAHLMSIKTYSELKQYCTFEDRYEYLRLNGIVAEDTFGYDRFMNQTFYHSIEWLRIRDEVIMRDHGCDLGIDGYEIYGRIIIHHLNPISPLDFKHSSKYLLTPEYLVSTTLNTHNAIHYGNLESLPKPLITRSQNDTCPWKH